MAVIKWLASPADYLSVWRDMQDYTNLRGADTTDEIWLCEHAPVYTLGQAGSPEHVLNPDGIPIVHCDRAGRSRHGGGPGHGLCAVRPAARRHVRQGIRHAARGRGHRHAGRGRRGGRLPQARGVYVPDPDGGGELAKIAALGIKIRNGRAYHGVSLSVDMDLTPFLGINPCGYAGLRTVDMAACGVRRELADVGEALARNLVAAWRRARHGGRRRTRL